jgi:hypothetical protein
MMKRIREQLEAGGGFNAACLFNLSAGIVPLPSNEEGEPLSDRVRAVADRISEMMILAHVQRAGERANDRQVQ